MSHLRRPISARCQCLLAKCLLGAAVLFAPLAVSPALAQTTTQPTSAVAGAKSAAVVAPDPVEADTIRREPGIVRAGGASTKPAGSTVFSSGSATRVVIALAAVIVLIAFLKYAAGRYLGIRSAGQKANRGVRVLSRTMVGHRQQLVLLQVGRKLVLVSDSAGKINPITEIVDPDEVAELAAQALGSGSGNRPSSPFASQMRRVTSSYEDEDAAAEGQSAARPANTPSTDLPTESAAAEPQDPEKNANLSGLAEKVRHLNRQFN